MRKKALKIALCLIVLYTAARLCYRGFIRDQILSFMYNNPVAIKIIESLSPKRPENVRPQYILTLYQMMKDVHDVLETVGIQYFADSGTLLGLIRHKGIIPWDDDLDICIAQRERAIFLQKAVPLLKLLGYNVKMGNMIVINATSKMIKLLPGEKYPGCDIAGVVEHKENFQVPQETYADWPPIKKKDLGTVRLYPFGSFHIWGPENPIPYLDAMYGKNWSKLAWKGDDHQYTDHRGASRKPFSIATYTPGQPVGPLKDNRRYIEREYKKQQ